MCPVRYSIIVISQMILWEIICQTPRYVEFVNLAVWHVTFLVVLDSNTFWDLVKSPVRMLKTLKKSLDDGAPHHARSTIIPMKVRRARIPFYR